VYKLVSQLSPGQKVSLERSAFESARMTTEHDGSQLLEFISQVNRKGNENRKLRNHTWFGFHTIFTYSAPCCESLRCHFSKLDFRWSRTYGN